MSVGDDATRDKQEGAGRFPTADSTPPEVVSAQLQALSAGNLTRVFELFSRARRAIITESGRAQGGGDRLLPPAQVLQERVRAMLVESCPGLIGHTSAEITSGLTLNERGGGRLARYRCRVKVVTADTQDMGDDGFWRLYAAANTTLYFVFTLTRQYDPPPTEQDLVRMAWDAREAARDNDCWFVWSIEPERRGDGGGDDPAGADKTPPGQELLLPTRGRQLIAA